MTRSKAPLSILVVDDNPGARALCRHLLNEEAATGFIITEAESGAEALARIALEKPDCILLDYILRVLSAGLWRRRQIRLGRDSSAPIEAQNPSQDCAREDSYLACG
ncbi:MAG: response regulator, partial [Gammaproteobacteria bacterium]